MFMAFKSGRSAVVVFQHPAQSFPALDNAGAAVRNRIREDQSVAEALMVALCVVMGYEVLNSCPEGFLPKQDQPFQTGLLDAANKSLGMGVQIRTPLLQLHGFHARILQRPQEFVCEQRIPIMDQVALTREQPVY